VQIKFIEKTMSYTGKELARHYILEHFSLSEDALISFIGKADVKIEHMVDLIDVKNNAPIYSPSMLHFLGEFFNFTLFETIALQRILIVIINEICEHEYSIKLKRIGDDLFYKNNAKLSVSIATKSPVSTLIHVGINIETKGTPVKTVGLQELKIPPKEFSLKVLEHFSGEIESMKFAKCKVRPVN